MKRLFQDIKPGFSSVSTSKRWIGAFIWILTTLSFYAILTVMRTRILVMTYNMVPELYIYDWPILNHNAIAFYNFFFAFIAVCLGQSLCFVYWFNRPRRIFEFRAIRRKVLVNEQRNLIWYFLAWFIQLAFIYGLWAGLALIGGFYVMQFYPDYAFLFILIMLVLFFHAWRTAVWVFRKHKFGKMLLILICFGIFSFGLSHIHFEDQKALKDILENVERRIKQKVYLPESDYAKFAAKKALIECLYVAENEGSPTIFYENKKLPMRQLGSRISEWQSVRDPHEVPYMSYILAVDSSIRLDYIRKMQCVFAGQGVRTLSFEVVPKLHKYDRRMYHWRLLRVRIPSVFFSDSMATKETNGHGANVLTIRQFSDGHLTVNNRRADIPALKDSVRSLIANHSDYIIDFQSNDSVMLSRYLSIIAAAKTVIQKMRDEYAWQKYSMSYDELGRTEMIEVNAKYPIEIWDIPVNDL